MGIEIINELKKIKGLTSEELSVKSGVPLGTLNKILNGTTKDPKFETLKALSKVLSFSMDYLADIPKMSNSNVYDVLKVDRTELIKILIDNTGLTLKAFSKKAGLPYSTLRSILDRGIGNASLDNVLKICRTLDVTIEKLEEIAANTPIKIKSEKIDVLDTLAVHFKGKNITPKKMKLLEQYIDALFQDDEE